jgi:hypothetical protein
MLRRLSTTEIRRCVVRPGMAAGVGNRLDSLTTDGIAMADDFSAEVKQFIDQNIESLPQLEALLLMRQDPKRLWSAQDISKSLYIPIDSARSLLADMTRRGFAAMEPSEDARYSYHVGSPALDELIGKMATVYQERRVAVVSWIYSKPLNKVQTFADAFRLRKESPP